MPCQRTESTCLTLVLLCLFCLLGAGPAGALSPQGSPYMISSTSQGSQKFPAAAALEGGSVAVLWENLITIAQESEVLGQLVDPAGSLQGGEFQANLHTASMQGSPALAAGCGGGFLAAWHSYEQDGERFGVFGRSFGASADPAGDEYQVNQTWACSQGWPALARQACGDFVAVWHDGHNQRLAGRRLDGAGGFASDEVSISQSPKYFLDRSAVAALEGGGWVAVWMDNDLDLTQTRVLGRKLGPDLSPVGDEFTVWQGSGEVNALPDVAPLPGGGWVVVLAPNPEPSGDSWIMAQIYDSPGNPSSAPVEVSGDRAAGHGAPAVAALSGGGWVAAWSKQTLTPMPDFTIAARAFDPAGSPSGGVIQVSEGGFTLKSMPDLAPLADGGMVVVWEEISDPMSQASVIKGRLLR